MNDSGVGVQGPSRHRPLTPRWCVVAVAVLLAATGCADDGLTSTSAVTRSPTSSAPTSSTANPSSVEMPSRQRPFSIRWVPEGYATPRSSGPEGVLQSPAKLVHRSSIATEAITIEVVSSETAATVATAFAGSERYSGDAGEWFVTRVVGGRMRMATTIGEFVAVLIEAPPTIGRDVLVQLARGVALPEQ